MESFPNDEPMTRPDGLRSLLRDPAYQQAFGHRRAALEIDRVVALDALPL